MKERAILFSAPMVRALLDGSKTLTRRVIKFPTLDVPSTYLGVNNALHVFANTEKWGGQMACPYGVPGDRLWVRESGNIARDKSAWMYADHGGKLAPSAPAGSESWVRDWKGCGSIHMPLWASRITLEITGVRVQRLQDISEADAVAEGVSPARGLRGDDDLTVSQIQVARDTARGSISVDYPISRYALLWDTINGDSAPWNSNPWVWALTFRRLTQ